MLARLEMTLVTETAQANGSGARGLFPLAQRRGSTLLPPLLPCRQEPQATVPSSRLNRGSQTLPQGAQWCCSAAVSVLQ